MAIVGAVMSLRLTNDEDAGLGFYVSFQRVNEGQMNPLPMSPKEKAAFPSFYSQCGRFCDILVTYLHPAGLIISASQYNPVERRDIAIDGRH